MTGVLQRRNLDRGRGETVKRHREKPVAYKPRNAGGFQKPGARPEADRPFPDTLRGNMACPQLDVRFLASRTVRRYISVVLSRPFCGTVWPSVAPRDKCSLGIRELLK